MLEVIYLNRRIPNGEAWTDAGRMLDHHKERPSIYFSLQTYIVEGVSAAKIGGVAIQMIFCQQKDQFNSTGFPYLIHNPREGHRG